MATVVESISSSQQNTWIEINLERLGENLRAIHKVAGLDRKILAVVKANAYGHGLLPVARALASQIECLGVSSLQEAIYLKEHELHVPILIFGRLHKEEIPAALLQDITLSISSYSEARDVSACASALNRKTPIHIKIDTGMGRLGIPYGESLETIEKIANLDHLILEGIYSHLPSAESDEKFTREQLRIFIKLIELLKGKGILFQYRHLANSAGIFTAKNSELNMVRPGLMLYGIYPSSKFYSAISIRPILTLKSRIILVKTVQAGESVGYSRDFIADKQTHIAILPIGYSHGYPFSASGRARVLYHGKMYGIAGRVSMDYIAVDLQDTPGKVGDTVTLIGEENGQSITVEHLALWANTIPYEIVTQLVASIPRFYK